MDHTSPNETHSTVINKRRFFRLWCKRCEEWLLAGAVDALDDTDNKEHLPCPVCGANVNDGLVKGRVVISRRSGPQS